MAADVVIPRHIAARPNCLHRPRAWRRRGPILLEGTCKSWMWSAMAMQDIKLRYSDSVRGPFWLTINTVIMVAAIGLIYARLFNMELARYLPFLTIGLVLWQYVSSLITGGCQTFLFSQNVIHQVPMPFSIQVAQRLPQSDRARSTTC